MRLTITRVVNRFKLLLALRKFNPKFSLQEIAEIADNLPYSQRMFYTKDALDALFGEAAEFVLEKDQEDVELEKSFDEAKDYIEARKWYDSLPESDRSKIDVLILGSVPHA